MVCTLVSRILGFVKNIVIAATFGATAKADVLNAVFNIPNNFRKLLAEGALSSAFIPVLSGCIVKDPRSPEARKLVRNILTFQLLILVPLLTFSVLFSRYIVTAFLDFPETEKMELSAALFRWICHYLLFISVGALLMGVLNSHGIFIIPALTPILFSVCVIGSILLLHRQLGVFSMAVGVLSGGLFQVLFQIPVFRRAGYDFKLDFGFKNEEFRRVIRLWFPVVATSSIFVINQQIAIRFSSGLQEGSASALSYALVVWQLPFGVFSTSVTTVLFPRLSRQAASGDKDGLIASLGYGMGFLFALLVPSSIFFIVMGKEIVKMVYQHGRFMLEDTIMTTQVLTAYSFGLFCVGAYTFLGRFFYSIKDYKTPFLVALLLTGIDITLSLWLKETYLRVAGLALANSCAFTLGFVVLIFIAYKKLGRLNGKKLGKTFSRITLSLILPTAALAGYTSALKAYTTSESSWNNVLILTGGLIIFSVLTVLFYYIAGVEIVRDMLSRRFKR